MDEHASSLYTAGPGANQVRSEQTVGGASTAIQGWAGQYATHHKNLIGEVSYGLPASALLTQEPLRRSRTRRPSTLTLHVSNPSHVTTTGDLPQLTSQLALESVPCTMVSSAYAASTSSNDSAPRTSHSSVYGFDQTNDAASMMVSQTPMYETSPPGMIPAYTYQQMVPQYQTRCRTMSQTSPSSSSQWSETYTAASPSTYSTTTTTTNTVYPVAPSHRPLPGAHVQYGNAIPLEAPTWTYQHAPVNVHPPQGPSSAPVQYVLGSQVPVSYPPPPREIIYYASSAPQAHYLNAPDSHEPTLSDSGLEPGSEPLRNRVRRKVAIGRVRLPEPGSFTTYGPKQSGAFTHSGVYGLDPSMPLSYPSPYRVEAQPLHAGPLTPTDSFPFQASPAALRGAPSVDGYAPSITADLYNDSLVSVPASVATSHVPLPLVSRMPPPSTMGASSFMGTSVLQAGTPASLSQSTFSSDDDDFNDHISSDPVREGPSRSYDQRASSSTLPIGSSDFDGFSRVPLTYMRAIETDEDGEELRDVHWVYPGLQTGETYPYDRSSTAEDRSSGSGWQQTELSSLGRKRVLQRAATVGSVPISFDNIDYSRFGSRQSRPKLAIACQGCRDKKLKCSGERPTCMNCKRRGLAVCEYAESIRRRGPGRKKIAALERKANSEARKQAKARSQANNVNGLDVASSDANNIYLTQH